MARKPARRSRRARLYKYDVTDPDVLALAAEVMPVGGRQAPTSAFVWVDGQDRPRRIKVSYPNGWTATISMDVNGRVSRRSATVKLTSQAAPPRPSPAMEYATIGDSDGDDGA